MKTIHEIFPQGMEEVAKHCLKYGNIVFDDNRETLKGFVRTYHISIDNEQVWIHKENGRVTGAAILPVAAYK